MQLNTNVEQLRAQPDVRLNRYNKREVNDKGHCGACIAFCCHSVCDNNYLIGVIYFSNSFSCFGFKSLVSATS